jgi:hypothetical protein
MTRGAGNRAFSVTEFREREMLETVHHTIRLRGGATLRIRDGAGMRLLATHGRVYIAREGEGADAILDAGASLDIAGEGLTLVRAEQPSVIAMVSTQAA